MRNNYFALLLGLLFSLSLHANGTKQKERSIQEWINLSKLNRIFFNDSLSYRQYQKLNVGFIGLTNQEKSFILFKYLPFLFESEDQSEINGMPIEYLVSRERVEKVSFDGSILTKEVLGVREDWVDKLIEDKGINVIIREALNQIDIYEERIPFLLGQYFPGPLSIASTKDIYNYQMSDTLIAVPRPTPSPSSADDPLEVNRSHPHEYPSQFDTIACKKISFRPRVPASNGFIGYVCITDNDRPTLCRFDAIVSGERNLNFIDQITIVHEYIPNGNGQWVPYRFDVCAELAIFKLFTREITHYTDFQFTTPDSTSYSSAKKFGGIENAIYNGTIIQKESYNRSAYNRPEEYWNDLRPEPLDQSESYNSSKFQKMMGGFSNDGPHTSFMGVVSDLLINNKIKMGVFEWTPVFSFISRNDIEGTRLRLGGRTNINFSKHLFLEGYAAYGTLDKKPKYYLSTEYSIPRKFLFAREFPIHSVKVSFGQDLKQPGQKLLTLDKDNAFYSFRQFPLDKMLMVREWRVDYKQEFKSGFSFTLSLNSRNENPAGNWTFDHLYGLTPNSRWGGLQTTEAELSLRFAPNERFYDLSTHRLYITRYNPVFTLSHTMGIKALGGQYYYNHTEFALSQSFSHLYLGILHAEMKMGKIWNQVPFPLLIIPQSNPSYLYRRECYNLMNPMEFIADSYFSIDLEHHFQGFFLNLFPFNKWMKLREVVSLKSLWGGLSDTNQPNRYNTGLVSPMDLSGNTFTYPIESKTPYVEFGVGIENIFRIFRVDYLWRMTYRDHPGINQNGFRVGATFKF